MAMESNMPSSSALSRHAISFQTGALNTTSERVPMMGSSYFGVNNTGGMVFSAGNSATLSNNLGLAQAGNSSSSLFLDHVPGLKHDADLAVEWSAEEQEKLNEGLRRYADQPNIMKYIKIAATLQDKTVRDVALRCRWMTRKRRKLEEHSLVKKVNSRKDKLVELSSTNSCLPQNMAAYTPMIRHMDQNELLSCEGIDAASRQLLKQNAQAFSQISTNLHMLKLQENLNLFYHARSNITSILDNMRDMPGIMSQMPPLPVTIDEDLASTILSPNISQPIMFGSHGRIQLKQEPRC
ncbi:hypothetical protein BT93_G1403 [Corymbia citriodora subsp. variegata]|nr:hypothetical protein BT93_G1403 [Corymbia citriodora subsp. variegata]